MSEDNLERVRRWIDDFNEGGLDAVIDEYWHDDIELVDPPELPDAGRFVGKAEVRRRVEGFIDFGWDEQFRVDDLVAVNDQVVMSWRLLGRTPIGDMPLDIPTAFVVSLQEGKIRRICQFIGKENAIQAARSSE